MVSRSLLRSMVATCAISSRGRAFQTTPTLPVRIDPLGRSEIADRLGLKENGGFLSIGSGPNMGYQLVDEHEVLCPISGAHQGMLSTAILSKAIEDRESADALANHHELVSQAIMAGSLAASVRNRCPDGSGVYYLPIVITLVESLMADEMAPFELGEKVFNSGGLETNEILMDLGSDLDPWGGDGTSVMMFACNTMADHNSATSDIYVLPVEKKGKVWRFSVDFKVCTINLQQITSFGNRDSTTPLRPDVWLKDDSY